MDYLEYVVKTADKKYNDNMHKSLTKMQKFLIKKGIASSFKEVKELPRIEIIGTDDNGRERLIMKDLMESQDINVLESSVGYNTYYPATKCGVIKSTTKTSGNYYTVFIVTSETPDEFDLKIHEYVYYNEIFYLRQIFTITGMSKKVPRQPLKKVDLETINEFFFNGFKRKELSEFTDMELKYIKDVKYNDTNAIACVSQILSTFRVVNFFLDDSSQYGNNHLNNDYFTLKNWNNNSLQVYSPISIHKKVINEQYIEEIINLDNGIRILNKHSIEYVINEIINRTKSNCLYCAVGFAFKSGLTSLSSAFTKIKENGPKTEIIVGSLQNFDNSISNNRIDKQTVTLLNSLVSQNLISLYTYKPSFYHGKFYYMCNRDKAYIITGSTNISRSAFRSNLELDVIYVTDRNSTLDNQFREWYYSLKEECTRIEKLSEDNFGDYNWDCELDAFKSLKNHIISNNEAQKKIDQLTDEETKYRLNIWMEKNPTSIYDDIDVGAFKDNDYTLFYFSTAKLAIFESFKPNNAYYAFRVKDSLSDLMEDIANMTKEEMSDSEFYIKRGYHILSHDNLRKKIDSFFCN